MFGALPHDIRLEHVATRSYPSGLVQREYLIAHWRRSIAANVVLLTSSVRRRRDDANAPGLGG